MLEQRNRDQRRSLGSQYTRPQRQPMKTVRDSGFDFVFMEAAFRAHQ